MGNKVLATWDATELSSAFDKLERRFSKKETTGIKMVMEQYGIKAANWAKKNHVWINRSGDAERYLMGGSGWESDTVIYAYVAHYVFYGVYLEERESFNGKYAILEKALQEYQDELKTSIMKLLDSYATK